MLVVFRVPPNCSFDVDDLEKPWHFKEPFDFIHSSNLSQGIRDWPSYIKRIYDNLTPGGVVELHESGMRFNTDDDTIPKGGAIEEWQKCFDEAAELAGLRDVRNYLERWLLDTGFIDVRVVVKKLPVGPWPKDPLKKVCPQFERTSTEHPRGFVVSPGPIDRARSNIASCCCARKAANQTT